MCHARTRCPMGMAVALIVAVMAFVVVPTACAQSQMDDDEELKKVAKSLAATLKIEKPVKDEVIPPVYDDMQGSFGGDIPSKYSLWVLARDRHNYFLMWPPMHVDVTNRWSQRNVRLATKGRWELHVCLANERAAKWLKRKANRNDFSGFTLLPKGMLTVRSVSVQRK